jgi:hypothetical protein
MGMSDQELKVLAEKVIAGEASKEEKLVFTNEINHILEELKVELKK